MTRRGDGVVGLFGGFLDEAKRFADARWPYPIERNVRRAVDGVADGRGVSALEVHARGVAYAIADDGEDLDDAEEIAELRAEVARLTERIDRLTEG